LKYPVISFIQSLTEFPAYWGERPELFAQIADGKTPEERSRLVLRWFIVRHPCFSLALDTILSSDELIRDLFLTAV
jgi:hypothetical protein